MHKQDYLLKMYRLQRLGSVIKNLQLQLNNCASTTKDRDIRGGNAYAKEWRTDNRNSRLCPCLLVFFFKKNMFSIMD
jgi:hypothetical protein